MGEAALGGDGSSAQGQCVRGGGPPLPGLRWWGPACRAGGGQGRVWTQTLRAAGVRSGGFWWGPGHGRRSEGPGCCEESRRKVNSSGVWRAEPCREAVRKTPLRPAFVNLKGNRFLDQHFTVAQRGWWDLSRVGGGANQGRWAETGSPESKLDRLMCSLEGLTGTGCKRPAIPRALVGSVDDQKSSSLALSHGASALGFPASPRARCHSGRFSLFQEICATPRLFAGSPQEGQVKQGLLGDCWFLCACAALQKSRHLLDQVSACRPRPPLLLSLPV